jgi:hypothetical protein
VTRDVDGRPIRLGDNSDSSTRFGTNAYRHNDACALGFSDGHAALNNDVVASVEAGDVTVDARQ